MEVENTIYKLMYTFTLYIEAGFVVTLICSQFGRSPKTHATIYVHCDTAH